VSIPDGSIYLGKVIHRRLRPRKHALSYNVFSLLADCGKLDELGKRQRLFSHNKFNLFSLFDCDHGDGGCLSSYLTYTAKRNGHDLPVARFMMLCYSRIRGYAFNPMTTYFGLDENGDTRLIIYEVNNTFGERHSYVLPAEPDRDGQVAQTCRKSFYVSPFNSDRGTYSFRATRPGENLTVGVALRDEAGPLMLAHFRGRRRPLHDGELLRALLSTGWMTVKVYAGIHYEAAKLWLKGVPLVAHPSKTRAQDLTQEESAKPVADWR
jgi:DUF1365 family protein